jgi:hypothetical protein
MPHAGSWLHCGYHLTTSIVAPALLSLPFAFAALGWAAGIICLVIGAVVTFYSYNLISLVLEHHAAQGRRQLRFRDMATDILGQLTLPKVSSFRFTGSYSQVLNGNRSFGQIMYDDDALD